MSNESGKQVGGGETSQLEFRASPESLLIDRIASIFGMQAPYDYFALEEAVRKAVAQETASLEKDRQLFSLTLEHEKQNWANVEKFEFQAQIVKLQNALRKQEIELISLKMKYDKLVAYANTVSYANAASYANEVGK